MIFSVSILRKVGKTTIVGNSGRLTFEVQISYYCTKSTMVSMIASKTFKSIDFRSAGT